MCEELRDKGTKLQVPPSPRDLVYLSFHLVIVTLLHLWVPVDGDIGLGWG